MRALILHAVLTHVFHEANAVGVVPLEYAIPARNNIHRAHKLRRFIQFIK